MTLQIRKEFIWSLMNCPSRDTDTGKPKWEVWGRENQELIKAKSQKVIKSCPPIIVIDVSQEVVVLEEAWVTLSLCLLLGHSVKFESLWPMDCGTPGFPFLQYLPEFTQTHVHRVGDAIYFQARILGWVATSFSRGSSWPSDWTHISCIGKQILYC